ncbi:MAG: triose-phosphate isomerase [Planctomycetaceae bacterium]|jgi:triosephosphate isomerase
MRRLFVAGNWKMNTLRESGVALATGLAKECHKSHPGVQVAVCPPFPFLLPVAAAIAGSGVELGAQNCSPEKPGAFTGEVASGMLLDVGCQWVILGHSERRALYGETDALVAQKTATALAAGLSVILCVGETLAERQANQTDAVLDRQMAGSLAGIDAAGLARIVIAYEPVWAIGTGLTATTEQAESAHSHLRKWLASRYNEGLADATRILYGGSVKAQNAKSLMEQPNVDGALVGGASLKLDDFLPIVRAAQELRPA